MSAVRLCLLGGFRLTRDGGPDPRVTTGPGRRLLAYLGIHGRVPRAELAGVLWPDASEAHAMGSLRTALWRLHRLPGPLVTCEPEVLALNESVVVDVRDLVESALLLAGADGLTRTQIEAPYAVDEHGGRVLAGGELLPGWYDEWVLHERERLRQLRLHALEGLSARLVGQGRFTAALEAAFASVRLEPLRESAHRAVIAVHVAEGNMCEAVRHYEAYRALLGRELGVAPSARLAAMVPAGALAAVSLPIPPARTNRSDVGVTAG
ncbi:AfsR/SARP family transcriptional regulator [Yinghuangia seranimata]|uniref:AfsR/SARP family transcriptional regulator n=1 Tax=Yinghuangia seranimata TaxID=408067 RepID=UPI00248B7728|nr:BTAD domain-containing putative transcriptional regulator [Yinghuangia seranimata]MDI2131698.1 BTAD domain-containing putative transcriptional regulator [Yinghuangia seranimata]